MQKSMIAGFLVAAFTNLTLMQSGAMADMVLAEPDALVEGADLTRAYPGVVLTVDGEPDRVVRAVVGFSDFLGRNIATTGTLIFTQVPNENQDSPFTFDFSEGTDPLRVDFLAPTDYVQIDMACEDDDRGEIRAFNDQGVQVATSNTVICDGRTANASGTTVISRGAADIAYVIAGGINEPLFLDNLQFNLLTPICDVELSPGPFFGNDWITADAFVLTNTSSVPITVEVKTWFTALGIEPISVEPLRRSGTVTLSPNSTEDFGPLRLGLKAQDLPVGPAEFVCRLVDPTQGYAYDVDVTGFEN